MIFYETWFVVKNFFVLKKVNHQIQNSRPRKTLNSHARERKVTFFKESPLLYVDRPFCFWKVEPQI